MTPQLLASFSVLLMVLGTGQPPVAAPAAAGLRPVCLPGTSGFVGPISRAAGDRALLPSPDAPQEKEPERWLASLPSPPGPHLEKVKALGKDAWLGLGSPLPDPRWGRARGRSWTPKMAYSSEFHLAFLYGSGQHGYVKPDGHYQDDLWAYDVNAHRWICLWPGSEAKTLRLKRDERGFEVNEREEPIPVAQIAHGYQNVAYLPAEKKFVFIQSDDPYWGKALPQRKEWLPARASQYGAGGSPRHPWFWNLRKGAWERDFSDGPGPDARCESVLEYLPTRKQLFFLYHQGAVWIYDPERRAWTNAAPSGPKPPFGIDPVACYDSRRDRIYIHRNEALWSYDVATNAWVDLRPAGSPPRGEQGGGHDKTMTYDSASDVVVLTDYRDVAEKKGIHVYSPAGNSWSKESGALPEAITPRMNLNAFYDPHLNVHVYHAAGDSEEDGAIWVYRYRPRP